ncbi:hypothetical protein [Luteolibacter sp. LG18]|uniref:glycine-rich domain-containing protein n=1 Tax=Luteolibacter sp. LG18 TaxID=2819286 RepID=UPI002B2804E0|nr:hypothetical protein llg_18340 [Luteolibacter sp. LG18]
MQKEHSPLWSRLEAFGLDEPDASLPFTARLAREQGWTHAETARVVREYKRFLFLAAVAGHPVSPSEPVDHAWHLHLLYTRSYWQRLCREVLGFDLHHEPTQGGHDERVKFHDWYSRTLESYRFHFDEDPPADLWPAPGAKKSGSSGARWFEPARFWLVPKFWPFRRGGHSPFA